MTRSTPRSPVSLAVESLETRELPALALPLTADPGANPAALSRPGTIGDTRAGAREVDVYKLDLSAGTTLTAATSQPAGAVAVDTSLRVFDAAGREVAANDDVAYPANRYSRISYPVPAAGTYYVAVSGYGNHRYDPATGGGLAAGATGPYTLTVTAPAPQPLAVTADLGRVTGAVTRTGAVGDGPLGDREVDVYRVVLDAGATLTATTSRPAGAAALDTYLRLFDPTGTPVAADDDSAGAGYSRLTYTAPAAGTYSIGVSEYHNRAYDPRTGLGLATGLTGPYALAVAAAASNRPPVLQPVADATTTHDRAVTVPLQATDPDGGPVTLAAGVVNPGAAPPAAVAVSGNTVTITPAAGYTGTFQVRVTASDGRLTADRTLAVTVLPNRPPTLAPIPDQSLPHGRVDLSLPLAGADPDGDPLLLSAVATDPALAAVAVRNGAVVVNPADDYSGPVRVRVTASDGRLQATREFTLTVGYDPVELAGRVLAVHGTPAADTATVSVDGAVLVVTVGTGRNSVTHRYPAGAVDRISFTGGRGTTWCGTGAHFP